MYSFDMQVALDNFPFILEGLKITLQITLMSFVIAILLGLVIGISRVFQVPILDQLLKIFIEVFRNTPVIVQIVWFYYVVPSVFNLNLTAIQASVLALGLNTAAYLAEVFRGGIFSVPQGQTEASRSLGFSSVSTLRYVVVPQASRKMLAPILNQLIVLIKDTALVAYIGVMDLMQRSFIVSTNTARPLESYTTVALIYLVLCFGASKLTSWIEKKYAVRE